VQNRNLILSVVPRNICVLIVTVHHSWWNIAAIRDFRIIHWGNKININLIYKPTFKKNCNNIIQNSLSAIYLLNYWLNEQVDIDQIQKISSRIIKYNIGLKDFIIHSSRYQYVRGSWSLTRSWKIVYWQIFFSEYISKHSRS
jgi:hypothetical protein